MLLFFSSYQLARLIKGLGSVRLTEQIYEKIYCADVRQQDAIRSETSSKSRKNCTRSNARIWLPRNRLVFALDVPLAQKSTLSYSQRSNFKYVLFLLMLTHALFWVNSQICTHALSTLFRFLSCPWLVSWTIVSPWTILRIAITHLAVFFALAKLASLFFR